MSMTKENMPLPTQEEERYYMEAQMAANYQQMELADAIKKVMDSGLAVVTPRIAVERYKQADMLKNTGFDA